MKRGRQKKAKRQSRRDIRFHRRLVCFCEAVNKLRMHQKGFDYTLDQFIELFSLEYIARGPGWGYML